MTRRKHYKVDLLKCKEMVKKLLAQPGVHYKDIVRAVREVGEEISEASLCRYNKNLKQVTERIRRAQEQVKVLIEEIKERPNTDLSEVASQLLLDGVIQTIAENEDTFEESDPVKMGLMVAQLEKSATLRERAKLAFKKEFEERTKKAAEKIKKTAKKGGLSAELVKQIEEEILGLTR